MRAVSLASNRGHRSDVSTIVSQVLFVLGGSNSLVRRGRRKKKKRKRKREEEEKKTKKKEKRRRRKKKKISQYLHTHRRYRTKLPPVKWSKVITLTIVISSCTDLNRVKLFTYTHIHTYAQC